MALLRGFILPVVLILIINNVSGQTVFVKEPENVETKYGSKVVIPCKIEKEATGCEWIKNNHEMSLDSNLLLKGDLTLGDCSLTVNNFIVANDGYWMCIANTVDGKLYSRRGKVTVSTNKPTKPEIQINTYNTKISSPFQIVFDPTNSDVIVTCTSADAYPLFNEDGSLLIYVNDELQPENRTLIDSTAKPGTNIITASIKLKLEADTDIKCEVRHESLETPYELTVTLLKPSSKFSLSKRAVKLMYSDDSDSIRISSLFGKRRELDLKWYRKTENDSDWVEIASNTNDQVMKPLSLPGSYKIKVELKQKNFFNVLIESQETTVLGYVPMKEVNIVSSLDLEIPRGEKRTMVCEADPDAYPEPDLYWIKATSSDIVLVGEGSTYIVGNNLDEKGYYKCDAVQKIFQQEVVISSYQAVKVSFKDELRVSSRLASKRILFVVFCIIAVFLTGLTVLIWMFSRSNDKSCHLEKSVPEKELSTQFYNDLKAAGIRPIRSGKRENFVIQKKIIRLQNDNDEMKTCECVGGPPILQHPLQRQWYTSDQIAIYTCPFTENKTVAVATCNLHQCSWEVKFISSCPIPRKECFDDPPKLDRNIIEDDWNGGSKNIATTIHYYCLNNPTLLPIQIAVCTENQTWHFVYNESSSMDCSCEQLPPSSENRHIHLKWDKSKIYGSIASYACIGSPIIIQTAICTSISDWVLQRNSTWEELFKENCECGDDFLSFNLPVHTKWNENFKLIGNVITYFCNNSFAVYVKMECSVHRKWEIIFLNLCVCVSDPPKLKPPIHRIWDNQSKDVNTKVKYYCNEEIDAILFQVAICNDSRVWEITTLKSCECLNDPPNTNFHLSKDGRHIGSTKNYYCLSDPKYGISHVLKCHGNGSWINFITYTCECPTLPQLEEFQTWTGISKFYINSTVFYHCSNDALSPIFQTAYCNIKKQWSLQYDGSNLVLKQTFCKCAEAPPVELFGYKRQWNATLNQIGNQVYYSCTGNDAPVLSGVCGYDRKWIFPMELDKKLLVTNNCECPKLLLDDHKVSWNGVENRIDSVATLWCSRRSSQIYKQLKCGVHKMWEEIYNDTCIVESTTTEVISTSTMSTALLLEEVESSTTQISTSTDFVEEDISIVTSTEESDLLTSSESFVKDAINATVFVKVMKLNFVGSKNQIMENFEKFVKNKSENFVEKENGIMTSTGDFIKEENSVVKSTEGFANDFGGVTLTENYDNEEIDLIRSDEENGVLFKQNISIASTIFPYKMRRSKSHIMPGLMQSVRGNKDKTDFGLQNNTQMAAGNSREVISFYVMIFELFVFGIL